METYCRTRKTVVFLPLVKTSQKFCHILNDAGFRAAEVNGSSDNRAQILKDFDDGKYNVLCNSMLLTEGWDCPSVDCVIILRATKSRSLYSQMVGRGTRLFPGKKEVLLLDFLWNTEQHELCRPACLIAETEDVAKKMTEKLNESNEPADLETLAQEAADDVVADREAALADKLAAMKKRKRKLVDPLQFELSIQAEDLASYVPSFGWEMMPPTEKQLHALEKFGIFPDEIDNAGKAKIILDKLIKRKELGLATARQIRLLEARGFQHVGTWTFEAATKLIARIAASGWRIPKGIIPAQYQPK